MKRIISLFLSLALSFCCLTPAFASQTATVTDAAEYNSYPLIIVRGMDFDGLVYKQGTPEEQNCFKGVSAGAIIKVLFKAIGSGVIHWSWEDGVEPVIEYVNDIMGLMACDENGNSAYDVSVKQYPSSLANYPETWDMGDDDEMGIIKRAVEKYGPANVYYYNYDWRLDPFIHADKLNDLVSAALRETGKDKVNIACFSMGGIETLSYLYKYGNDSVNRVAFMSSTFFGTHVTTDLLRGLVSINADRLHIYLNQMVARDRKVLTFLFDALYKIKVMDGLANLVNRIIPKIKDKVYDEFLLNTFGTIPAVWALVLPEGYDEAVEYMFGRDRDKYADFIKLTEEYQKMSSERSALLREFEAEGTSIVVCAGYNRACIPVYDGGGGNGDAILEADRMLAGATVAPVGETLGDGYVPATEGMLSPDRVVDLSGVLFPETTWAINGSPHVSASYGTEYSDFLFWLIEYEGRVTVNSNPRYPRFMSSSDKEELRVN